MKENKNVKLLSASEGGFAFAIMICAYIFISFIGQTIAGAIFGEKSVAYIAVCSLFSALAMLGVILYFTLYKKVEFKTFSGINKFKPISLLLAILLSFGMFFGLGFINDLFAGIFKSWGLNVSAVSIPLDNAFHLILFSVLFALIPAVTEEIFFRALMLKSLESVKAVWAVTAVSVTFALYHCSVSQFIYQLIYGAGLAMLFMYVKSIIPCVIAHFINNISVIIFEYFKFSINLYNPLIIAGGILALIIFALITVLSIIKLEKTKKEFSSVKKFYFPFAIFGCVICLALLIGNLFVV